jgi:hypothetical protein
MQRRTNQAVFAVLAMLTIWIVIHTSRINDIDSDVTVLNRTSNSMMNRLISLESEETEHSYFDLYEEQNRYLQSFESDLTFKETFKKMRAEYGAGHIFDWNKRLFTTYYAEELMLTSITEKENR